jgi:SHS2 domain-containing protein
LKRFEYINSTADIGVRAYGNDLAEAFGNAAYGLFSIITDLRNVRRSEVRVVDIRAESPEDLLYDWLNQLIYLFDTEGVLFKACVIRDFDGKSLKAECWGEKTDLSRHQIKMSVKAATYHRLRVDPDKNQVEVIFDI